jgi:hypothetical protein
VEKLILVGWLAEEKNKEKKDAVDAEYRDCSQLSCFSIQ